MSLSLEQRTKDFATWVSVYYPPVPPSALSTYSVADLLARQELAATPAYKGSLSSFQRISTMERMSKADVQQTTDFSIMERSSEVMRAIPREIFWNNTRRALWEPEVDPNCGEEVTFPHLKVSVLWCNMTIGDCIWAVKLLFARKAEEDAIGESRRRDVVFRCMEGANHFVSPVIYIIH